MMRVLHSLRTRFACGFVTLLVLWATPLIADVTLPAVFSEHMVLQQKQAVPVWGWAGAGETVRVSLGDQAVEARAGANGRWSVQLEPLQAGGPHSLTVSGTNEIVIGDVWIGEVWLASGQSNMAMQVSRVRDAQQEMAQARYPRIRMFTTARQSSPTPQDTCQGSWQVCTPETVGQFSATAYFFARKLHEELDVPVGILNSSWGGTAVEAWTSVPAQKRVAAIAPVLQQWQQTIAAYDPAQAQAQYAARLERWKQQAKAARDSGQKPPRRPTPAADPRTNQNRPGNLFNGMIHPLIPYGIRGAIWYQGERNRRQFAELYGVQLQTLIRDWRARWDDETLPFLFVQLPNFMALQSAPIENDGWVLVREGMRQTLSLPQTGMAVTTDIGEANDIHPRNKQDVGKRLALWALGTTYGKPLVYSGPLYTESKPVRRGDGTAAIAIHFTHTAEGLQADSAALQGFAIAGQNREFVEAEARIVDGTVEVWSEKVTDPAAVRYNWAPNPLGTLRNSAGLPASPFRTDDWPIEIAAP